MTTLTIICALNLAINVGAVLGAALYCAMPYGRH